MYLCVCMSDGKPSVYPRHIVTEGAGDTNKGMKIEWATQKDGDLWIGSFGKEYTSRHHTHRQAGRPELANPVCVYMCVDPKGDIINENNMWVVALSSNGKMQRFNWKPAYDAVRRYVYVNKKRTSERTVPSSLQSSGRPLSRLLHP